MSTGSSFRINGVAQTFGGGSGAWNASGSHIYANNNGNVGIKTTSPAYDLDVNGDINLTGSLRINGVAQTFGGGGGSSYWVYNGATYSLSFVNGIFGIGTNSPGYTLDVAGDINMSTGSSFRINGVAQTFGFTGNIADYITHTGDTDTKFGFPDVDKFIVNTAGSERLTIFNNGNIGINQTNPQYKLDVDGDINMSTGSSFRINGVAQTFGVTEIADYITHTGDTDTKFGFPDVDKFIVNTAGSERLTIFNNGNTGINQTNPQYKLDVDGDINLTGDLRINGIIQSVGGGGGGGSSVWATSGNDVYRASGKVGIGKTNPTYA
ncbi:MAG: hypothetical protein Ct9H90mV1_0040 [Prasinovirus sp.]|nr:MAG: hypothetical protein Ct9H90mV1_0040 [Prasinovirus sp.]